jgi:hypothetical protein
MSNDVGDFIAFAKAIPAKKYIVKASVHQQLKPLNPI